MRPYPLLSGPWEEAGPGGVWRPFLTCLPKGHSGVDAYDSSVGHGCVGAGRGPRDRTYANEVGVFFFFYLAESRGMGALFETVGAATGHCRGGERAVLMRGGAYPGLVEQGVTPFAHGGPRSVFTSFHLSFR